MKVFIQKIETKQLLGRSGDWVASSEDALLFQDLYQADQYVTRNGLSDVHLVARFDHGYISLNSAARRDPAPVRH